MRALESWKVSGATPFRGYTIEPAGCSLYCGPGVLALLKIDPPERWRSDLCCAGMDIGTYKTRCQDFCVL